MLGKADQNRFHVTAASYLPELYHDLVLGGKWFRAIDAVHEKYGASS